MARQQLNKNGATADKMAVRCGARVRRFRTALSFGACVKRTEYKERPRDNRRDILLAMKCYIAFCIGIVALALTPVQTAAASSTPTLRAFVQGDTARLPDFIEDLGQELAERGITFRPVEHGVVYDYNIVLAQETTFGTAAAAVIVLDRSGLFITSVVRPGRFSGKGAFNASAKELAKKIAILKGIRNP